MAGRTKPRIFSVAGDLISGAWGVYSHITTATQLPADAGEVAKMLADPPVYLPWLLFVAFVIITAWAFWPTGRSEPEARNDGRSIVAGRDAIGNRIGDDHHHYPEETSVLAGLFQSLDRSLKRREIEALEERNRLDRETLAERKGDPDAN